MIVELLDDLEESLESNPTNKKELNNITTKILSKQEGKEALFRYFEDINTTSNQKKTLLTSLERKTTTAVFNSISVEQRIAFLENLNDGDVCDSLPQIS